MGNGLPHDPSPHMTERERLRLRLGRPGAQAPVQSERDRLREARRFRLLEKIGVPAETAAVLSASRPPESRAPLSPTLLALVRGEPTPLPPSAPSPTAP